MNSELWACEPGRLHGYLMLLENATPDQIEQANALFGDQNLPRIASIEGDTATISIVGVLRKHPASAIARFFGLGGTSYQEIIKAAEQIRHNVAINNVKLIFDTPGGIVDGGDEAYQAIADLAKEKHVVAEARGMLCSMGYYLASSAHEIVSSAPPNLIGSIGVVVAYTSWKKFDEKMGIREVVIRSKNAPNKSLDPEDEKGRQALQQRLDAIERIFYRRISEGRRISAEQIAEKFGQGDVFVSQDPDPDKPDAIKAGMIDRVIASVSHTEAGKPSRKNGVENQEDSTVDEAEVKRIKEAAQVMCDEKYPASIRTLAAKVAAGQSEIESLQVAVASFNDGKFEQPAGEDDQVAMAAGNEKQIMNLVAQDKLRAGIGGK